MTQSDTQPVIPVREFFALDVRSLALFRVALAVFILLDWIDRLPDLRILYSDEGILPRNLITGIHPFSLHMLHGSVWFQAILFAIAIGLSLLLLLGWRTPWICFWNFLFLVSIHARNPPMMQGGDVLLRMLTFWSIFLPLGACWSLDAARSSAKPPRDVVSPGSVGYVLQLCLVYWFAAAWKWLGPWREEGTAVYLALHVDHFPTRLGLILREYPDLCWFLTHATIWIETLGPVLLFLPFNVGLQRMLCVALFIHFHAGLALTMELGHFPFVGMIGWLALVPSGFWNRLVPRLRSPEVAKLTLVVDPDRAKTARRLAYLKTFLLLQEIPLREARSESGEQARCRKQGGWALLDESSELFSQEAVRRLIACSPLWLPSSGLLVRTVSNWLSRPGGRKRPEPVPPGWMPPSGLMANTLAIFFIVYIVSYNVFHFVGARAQELPPEERAKWFVVPDQFGQLGTALGIDQAWGLFAPQPGRYVGWFVVVGEQKNGELVDVYNNAPLSWEKPKFLTLTYESGHWRKLRMNLAAPAAYPYLLPGFTRYYFDEWNRRHEGNKKLKSLSVWWMRETTVPPGETPPPPEKILLGTYTPPTLKPSFAKGTIVVLGIRPDGTRIDLMRAGAVVPEGNPDLGPTVPIVSPLYLTVTELANSDAAKYVLDGLARYLFDEWNKTKPDAAIQKLQILRMEPREGGRVEPVLLVESLGK